MIITANEKVKEKELKKKNVSSKKREEELLGETGSFEIIKKKRK